MGEISELMLSGELCESCGAFLGGGRFAVPLLCRDCSAARWVAGHDVRRVGKFYQDLGASVYDRQYKHLAATLDKVTCPTCGRRVKPAGLSDHTRVVHGAPTENKVTP